MKTIGTYVKYNDATLKYSVNLITYILDFSLWYRLYASISAFFRASETEP